MANYNLRYVSADQIDYVDPAGTTAALATAGTLAAYGKMTTKSVAKSSSATFTVSKNKRYLLIVFGGAGANQTCLYGIVAGATEAYLAAIAVPGTPQITVTASTFTITVANGNSGAAAYAYLVDMPD